MSGPLPAPSEPSVARPMAAWAQIAESGGLWSMRLMRGLYRLLGRRVSRALIWPIALYFIAVRRKSREAHARYVDALRAHHGEQVHPPPTFWTAHRHTWEFGINLFDRMVAWGGELADIEFLHRGSEHLFRLAKEGRGAILLGSHLGSFDMMRMLAGHHGLVVNVLMYTQNAERISAFLRRLDPESQVRVIALDPHSTRTAFEIRRCLDRGEFVGILGDRIWPGERAVRSVSFLGHPAPFSLRPFLLAGVLGAPLLFALCVRRDDATYEAIVEPLYEGGPIPRKERDAVAARWLDDYVARLEAGCQDSPHQWFNFYDTWASEGSGS